MTVTVTPTVEIVTETETFTDHGVTETATVTSTVTVTPDVSVVTYTETITPSWTN